MDAGLPCREIERRLGVLGLGPQHIDAVVLSHEHGDHAKGAWKFARQHQVLLCATEGTFRRLRRGRTNRSVEWQRIKAGRDVKLGRLTIEVFPTPHDAVESVGFAFARDGLRFAHFTDIGYISPPVAQAIEDAQIVLLEANHDVDMLKHGPYPDSVKYRVGSRFGHLSNDALARYLEERLPDSVRHLFLAHLSRTNNHESLALAVCRRALARRGGRGPQLLMTYPEKATELLRLAPSRPKPAIPAQAALPF